MDWFLYDRDHRHERVKLILEVGQLGSEIHSSLIIEDPSKKKKKKKKILNVKIENVN